MDPDRRNPSGARFARWAILLALPLALAALVTPRVIRWARAERNALPATLARNLPEGAAEAPVAGEPARLPEDPSADQIEADRAARLDAGQIERRNLQHATSYAPRAARPDADGERLAPFHGFGLSVESTPAGAMVRVDGAEVGETPIVASVTCEPGRELEVRLEKPGLRPERRRVRCRHDALLELSFTLSR